MAKRKKVSKIFVLDTSVILHDHLSIKSFEEHDVAIPITVLEELDNFKKGNDVKNFSARSFIRILDKLSKEHMLQDWIPINGPDKGRFKIVMVNENKYQDATKIFADRKNDHQILNAALTLTEQEKDKKVILVSKDINLRLKAKALNLAAEDFETGKVENSSVIFSGKFEVTDVDTDIIQEL